MPIKPSDVTDYQSGSLELIRDVCLSVATILDEIMEQIVIIGGLVPSLIIDQENLPPQADRHFGTLDLDLGLSLAILENDQFRQIGRRFRHAGFLPDSIDEERRAGPRWKIPWQGRWVTVDLLLEPTSDEDWDGQHRNLDSDLTAIIASSLRVAFADRSRMTLLGHLASGEMASKDVWVCGPGAFIVMKAIAFDFRLESKGRKDAYDLYYLLRNYGSGIQDVVEHLRLILGFPETIRAMQILQTHSLDSAKQGPRAVALFGTLGLDDEIQADVAGAVRELLRGCGRI